MADNYGAGYQKADLTIEVKLVVLAYKLSDEYRNEFEDFYNTVIIPWFQRNHVVNVQSWIAGDSLIVVSSAPMPPWSEISGLDKYLAQPAPVRTDALRRFRLDEGASAAGYAAD